MLLANAIGQPVAAGAFPTHYATHELCETARPAVVAAVQKEVTLTRPGFTVADSKCITQDALDKASTSGKLRHSPLKGQKDAYISN
jgi:hypothetical protein